MIKQLINSIAAVKASAPIQEPLETDLMVSATLTLALDSRLSAGNYLT